MKKINLLLFTILSYSTAFAQSPNWKYIRPSNTGVAAEEHHFVTGDRFGNIWTGGRSGIEHEGSVVRFNHTDTIFTCWSNFEGYIQSEWVYDAKIDSNDVLWVATGDGLSKYDGTSWITYTTLNTPLPSDNIRSVSFDSQNNVWITFQEVNMAVGGIAKFDGTNWTIYTPGNSNLPNYECFNILIDSQNNKWIHSKYSVTKFDGLNFINYTSTNSGLAGSEVYDIALDSADNLYAVTHGPFYSEVNVFDGINWTYINQTNTSALTGYVLYNIYLKDDKIILFGGGANYTVIIFDGTNWTTHIAGDAILDVFIDKDDNYWAAGLSSVSKFVVGGQWKDYMRYSAGLSEHNNYNIFVDSKNRFWAANGNGGIQIFDCPKWQSYGPANQGLYPSPQSLSFVGASICEDSFGNIWFAYYSTDGTVVKIPNGNYQDYAAWQTFNLSNSDVSWIEESFADGFGNVFFYSDYGTHMYNNTTGAWSFWDLTNSPLQYDSYGFGTDSSGKAYFGGYQQIAIYDNGVWSLMNLTSLGTTITAVNDIAFDSQNNMWLATDEGVWKYDGTNWTTWNENNSAIADNHVSSVAINQNDSVFVSSFGSAGFINGGISVLNGTTWTTFTISNSDLPSEQIDDIELDTLGNLWINTFTQGVTVYHNGGVLGFDCKDYTLQGGGTTGVNSIAYATNADIISYPNPFSITTTLEFNLNETKNVSISIFDVVGREAKSITAKNIQSGKNKINLDLSELNNGIYFCRIKSNQNSQTIKLIKN
ncbi:MAG: T9SS type A sorting domain-containing protein [Bacteroidia bacterium]